MILVVDDDVDLRTVLCEALEDAGHVPLGASNGREALARLRQEPAIQLILLDLMMPIMSGWEFRTQQLADPKLSAIPTIVLTAAADLTRTPIDATTILRKPVSLATLLREVERLLQR